MGVFSEMCIEGYDAKKVNIKLCGALNNTEDKVLFILENYEKARNSYVELQIAYARHFIPDKVLFEDVIREMPKIETINRCRRKIIETRPDLKGDEEVEACRGILEGGFIEYALQGKKY